MSKLLKKTVAGVLLIATALFLAAGCNSITVPQNAPQTQTSMTASASTNNPSPTISAPPPAVESAQVEEAITQAPPTEPVQPEAPTYATPIQWEDPNIEKAVRSLLDRPTGEITPAYLNGITTLSVVGNDILISSPFDLIRVQGEVTSIQDISHFNYLMTLQLSGLDITDISPLSNIANLFTLSLNGNKITDISPLSNLAGLTSLYLSSNEITDISPLSNLTNLTTLTLNGNKITDISPLSHLTNLTFLDISANPIEDYSPLDSLSADCKITK